MSYRARPNSRVLLSRAPSRALRRQCACGQHAAGGECDACRLKREQGGEAGGIQPETGLAEAAAVFSGAGQPLDGSTRKFMEARFGRDFSHVRVHADGQAAASAASLGAHAFTAGSEIVFNRGQYAPGTPRGNALIAHELAHVAQNEGVAGRPRDFAQGVSDPSDASEHEARRAAETVPAGGSISVARGPDAAVQRDPEDVAVGLGVGALVTGGLVGLGLGIAALAGAFKSKKKPKAEEKPKKKEEAAEKKPEERPKISFDEALEEGAMVLKPGFGVACGQEKGIDPADSYDAREWREAPERGLRGMVIVATTPSRWTAMDHLIKNIDKDVPKAGGGTTRWHFDCFEAVEVLRLYAFWRTMTPAEFDRMITTLEIGFEASSNKLWDKPFLADKPGGAAYTEGEVTSSTRPGVVSFEVPKIPAGKSWKQLLDEAPKGSQVIFTNKDAEKKCAKDKTLSFCAFIHENCTKLGPDRFWAHPFGIVDSATIIDKMAKAVMDPAPVPPGYKEKYIYISAIRHPKEGPVTI